MSLLDLVFAPRSSYDKLTGEELLTPKQVRREALFALRNEYRKYAEKINIFNEIV